MNSKVKADVNGIASQMNTFEFFVGVLDVILREHFNNLSKTLQMITS